MLIMDFVASFFAIQYCYTVVDSEQECTFLIYKELDINKWL